MTETKRPLKVFLCHASADKRVVRELYKRLNADGIDAWLDEEKLLPGVYWRDEIPKAIQETDVVLVCLSRNSVTKEGYIQKEIKFALDQADEKLEGTIFLIPAKLEECEVPRRLQYWQWVNLFFDGEAFEEIGYQKLFRALKTRSEHIGALLPTGNAPPISPKTNSSLAQNDLTSPVSQDTPLAKFDLRETNDKKKSSKAKRKRAQGSKSTDKNYTRPTIPNQGKIPESERQGNYSTPIVVVGWVLSATVLLLLCLVLFGLLYSYI